MKPASKKITSFGFLLLGLMPLLFVLIFIVQQKMIRHQMREKLDTERLQTIVIPEGDVIWMDKHEIWVNESMFDIHTRELINGVYTFTGLYDEKETRLLEQNKQANKDNNEESQVLTCFFKSLQLIFYGRDENPFLGYNLTLYFSPRLTPTLTDPFKSIPTPPPDFGCRS